MKTVTHLILLALLVLNTACAPDNNDGRQKRMLVYGDSISIGYNDKVTARMEEYGYKVEHTNYEDGSIQNVRNTDNGLLFIDRWLNQNGTEKWDIVTFNHGLHDIKPVNETDVEKYVSNLRIIALKIKAKSQKAIFLTMTDVREEWSGGERTNANVIKYNEAAVELMNELGIEVYDLHADALDIPEMHNYGESAHFTTEGYEYLGNKISDQIIRSLYVR